MLKDYKTLEKAQHFIEDAGLPRAVDDFLAINGERLGNKEQSSIHEYTSWPQILF